MWAGESTGIRTRNICNSEVTRFLRILVPPWAGSRAKVDNLSWGHYLSFGKGCHLALWGRVKDGFSQDSTAERGMASTTPRSWRVTFEMTHHILFTLSFTQQKSEWHNHFSLLSGKHEHLSICSVRKSFNASLSASCLSTHGFLLWNTCSVRTFHSRSNATFELRPLFLTKKFFWRISYMSANSTFPPTPLPSPLHSPSNPASNYYCCVYRKEGGGRREREREERRGCSFSGTSMYMFRADHLELDNLDNLGLSWRKLILLFLAAINYL